MAERKPRRADIGVFTGTTFLQIVPPPSEPGMLYVMPPGALIWHNADNAARTFVMEMRKGGLAIEFFNTELGAGEGFAWPFEIVIANDFDGVWGKVTASPTTEPTWQYHGRLEADFAPERII